MTKEEINRWVGLMIKAWRKNKGLTRYQLSKHSGIQQISIKNIEEGNGMRVETLFKLLEAMDLEMTIGRKLSIVRKPLG